MKIRLKYILFVLASLILAACTQRDEPQSSSASGNDLPDFTIFLKDYNVVWEEGGGSRSLVGISDVWQRQIHNLMYIFYDRDGYIESIFYQEVEPTMKLTMSFNDFKVNGNANVTVDGAMFLIVNTAEMDVETYCKNNNIAYTKGYPILVSKIQGGSEGNYDMFNDLPYWRQTIPSVSAFMQNSNYPLFPASTGAVGEGVNGGDWSVGRPDRILFFGYFDGIHETDDVNLQVALGRIAARIRLALSGDGLGKQARIILTNVPKQTILFPEVPGVVSLKPEELWTCYEELIDNQENNGGYGGINSSNSTGSVIYYTAENDISYTKRPVKLRIEVWDTYSSTRKLGDEGNINKTPADSTYNRLGKPDRVYKVELGHDSPKDPNRNLNLLRNTSYTFNLVLHKNQPNSLPAKSRSTAPGCYELYPVKE